MVGLGLIGSLPGMVSSMASPNPGFLAVLGLPRPIGQVILLLIARQGFGLAKAWDPAVTAVSDKGGVKGHVGFVAASPVGKGALAARACGLGMLAPPRHWCDAG